MGVLQDWDFNTLIKEEKRTTCAVLLASSGSLGVILPAYRMGHPKRNRVGRTSGLRLQFATQRLNRSRSTQWLVADPTNAVIITAYDPRKERILRKHIQGKQDEGYNKQELNRKRYETTGTRTKTSIITDDLLKRGEEEEENFQEEEEENFHHYRLLKGQRRRRRRNFRRSLEAV